MEDQVVSMAIMANILLHLQLYKQNILESLMLQLVQLLKKNLLRHNQNCKHV